MRSNKKISENPRLNDVVFEMSDSIPVVDKESNPKKTGFRLSVPYIVGEIVILSKPNGRFGSMDGLYQWPEMTEETAQILTKLYITRKIHSEKSIEDHILRIEIEEVKPRIYNKAQQSLTGRKLNAFEVKGTLYKIVKGT